MQIEQAPNHGSDVMHQYHDLVRKDVFPFIPDGCGKLLDFGGGIGATALALRNSHKTEEAGVIDMVPSAEQLPDLDFRYSCNVEDIATTTGLLNQQAPFDVILCLDILEHLRAPWDTIKMLHGLLSPGGYIVSSIPNIRNYEAVLPLVFRDKWKLTDRGILDATHLRFFVKETAVELMTSSGLTLDLVEALPSGGRKIRVFRALTAGLLNSFTDQQYMVRVRNV
jgi:2-polyprenyl-3-methyl-5-hydroxy-6-metoxy-1,4-benzoquinol methylase